MRNQDKYNWYDAWLTFFVVVSAVMIGHMLAGCGVHVSSDPIQVDPTTVIHDVDWNLDQVVEVFEDLCRKAVPEEQVEQCVEIKITQFLGMIGGLR